MSSTVIPSTLSVPSSPSMTSSLQPLLDANQPKQKTHGIFCRLFNASVEERERKRAEKKAAKEAKYMAKYYIPPEELARLYEKVREYKKAQEEKYPPTPAPSTPEAKEETSKPPKMIKAHNFSGLRGKNLLEHLLDGTDVGDRF